VIDLDLVYEMLDVRLRPKADERLWRQSRRVAGQLASLLLRNGCLVVVEGGDFTTRDALSEFESELPKEAVVRLVLLDVDFETALERARLDDSRRISKDRAFLTAHYADFSAEWSGRDYLQLDTGSVSLADAARAVVESLAPGE
jgi:hypothetical protein